MSELWLPANKLSFSKIDEVAVGKLVIVPLTAKADHALQIGVRLRRDGSHSVLALTEFNKPDNRAGDIVNLTGEVLAVDATVGVEAEAEALATSSFGRDYRPGELVAAGGRFGVAAYFDRHLIGHKLVRPVDVSSWEVMKSAEIADVVFGAWRLRIEFDGLKPILWRPFDVSVQPAVAA